MQKTKKENIKMKKLTINLLRNLFDIFLPPRCLVCRDVVYKENGLCHKCFKNFCFLSDQSCPVCGRPYTFPVEKNELICGKCLTNPPSLQGLKAVFAYDEYSKKLILSFKHADRTDLVPFLSKLLYYRGKHILENADYIMPVPLYWQRLMKRKYNQSALLTVKLSKITGKPYLLNTLLRIKKTQSQGHKTREERIKNIQNAFCVHHAEKIKGKTIVLIDDVYTTGATLNECAKVLRQAGAKRVEALVLARVCYFE